MKRTPQIIRRTAWGYRSSAAVFAVFEQNAARAAEKAAAIPEYPRSIRKRLQSAKAAQNAPKQDSLQRMVDREAKRAEGKGAGYDRWAAVHNLKQMAATVAAMEQTVIERLKAFFERFFGIG